MNMEEQVRQVIVDELKRQAEADGRGLEVKTEPDGGLVAHGRIDLEALSMAVVGHLAGGP